MDSQKKLSISISGALYKRLKIAKKKYHINFSAMMREELEKALDRLYRFEQFEKK